MHRRGLQCLPDIPCCSSHIRHASIIPKRKVPQNARIPPEEYRHMKGEANQVMKMAATQSGKVGWRSADTKGQINKKITSDVKAAQNRSVPASTEKLQFQSIAVGEDESFENNLYQLGKAQKERIPAGTFVEMRRNEITIRGVVLFSLPTGGKWLVHVLSFHGEIVSNVEADIMFMIPSFIDKDIVRKCGMHPIAVNDQEVAGRVQVLRRLKAFEKQFEREYTRVSSRLATIYDQLKSSNPDEWKQVTTYEAATSLVKKGETIPVIIILAVHQFLFQRHREFVAEGTNFLARQCFWIRPQSHLKAMQMVDEMIYRKDVRLEAFISKMKKIIAASRRNASQTWSDQPSRQPMKDFDFTSTDLLILRYFQDSLRTRRTIQKDAYIVSQAYILKRINMYEGDVNDIMVLNLLNDTGVIAPWEDVATRELDINLPMTGVVAQQTKQIKLTTTSISNSPVAAPFGPGEFYAHDIAESIRHDFGRLPVYVIDDVHAEELDDGVSIERIPSEPGCTWLHVHVADPTAILPPTHALSQQAYRQLETYYFVDRTIPMLPRGEIFERMSLGYASQSGQPENVMSFSMKVNEEGEIVDYKVRAGLVRNVKQLRYDDVDAAMGLPPVAISYPFGNPNASGQLQTPKYDSTTMEDLSLLRKVTRKLVDERVQNGAFTFTIGSVTMSIDPKPTFELLGTSRPSRFSGFPQMTYMVQEMAVQESGSRQIVAECMKSASRVASRFFRDRGIPAIRRSVAQMQTEVQGGMELLMASRDENGYAPYHTAVKLGIISPGSRYDLIPAAHSLLGVPDGEGYTRVTSPLRRFCDMIAHWQIKHALLSPSQPSSPLFSEDWLRRFADNLGMHESKTRRMQMVQNNFWAMRFLQRWIAEWEMGAHRDKPNPLDSLIAQSSGNVMLDWRTSTHQLQVFLPQLGLKATLNDINTDDQWDIGEVIPVKLDKLEIGVRPHLSVTVR